MFVTNWLDDLNVYIKENSYGLAAIRVVEYNNATYGIIEPYGYYIINYKSEIFLMRASNVAIKFFVRNDVVVTSITYTGEITIGFVDALFLNPPSSSSKIQKFVLFHDRNPRHYSAIQLINKCLDMRILHL